MDGVTAAVTSPLVQITARANGDGPDPRFRQVTTPARLRLARSVRLLAGFGALRVDQLEALLLLHDGLTPASRRVTTYRVLAELRERAFAQTVGLAGPGGPGRAFVLSPTGRR